MNRKPTDKIEAEIEKDRASLVSTLGELQDRMSIETLAQDALGMIRTNAAAYTSTVDRAVRANPWALGLVGAGIAWLVLRNRSAASGPVETSGEDGDWSDVVDALRDTATATLHDLEDQAREYAESLRQGVASGVEAARDFAAERAAVLAEFTQDMKDSLMSGLDDLSDTARDRIMAMREQAYAARIRGEQMAAGGAREAGRLIDDHPVLAGGMAMALGVALAAFMSHGRTKDAAGDAEKQQSLMNEARLLARRERYAATRAAKSVVAEVKSGAKAVSGAAEYAADTAAAIKHRVQDDLAKPHTAGGASKKPTSDASKSSH